MNDLITINDNTPTTTSLVIAEHFGKRHDNVLQAIDKLDVPDEFRLLNFQESSYLSEQGKEQRCFVITRDGFAILTMGFTGKSATEWKLKFLEAFNKMAEDIKRLQDQNYALAVSNNKLLSQQVKSLSYDALYGPSAKKLEIEKVREERSLLNAQIRHEKAKTSTDDRIKALELEIARLNKRVEKLEKGGLDNEAEWDKIRNRKFGTMRFDYLH